MVIDDKEASKTKIQLKLQRRIQELESVEKEILQVCMDVCLRDRRYPDSKDLAYEILRLMKWNFIFDDGEDEPDQ